MVCLKKENFKSIFEKNKTNIPNHKILNIQYYGKFGTESKFAGLITQKPNLHGFNFSHLVKIYIHYIF